MASGPGQPTKVSTALAKRIAASIRKGIRMADAAEAAGVDRSSLFNWLKWGDAGQEPYASFAKIVREAVSAGKRPKQSG